ncbi:MAG: ATP-binding protein [Jatrophihabitans sp.]|uniref:ATP-binding protein n=1 Tax=Jatrophihabitans sp. TaxID=1932789 RepID=UPI0039126A09
MCLEARRSFACEPESPGHARSFCRAYLNPVVGHVADGREVVATAELVVTELVTNAINAGCSAEVAVEFALHHSVLHVSVQDDAAGQLRVQNPSEIDAHGRGLRIVDALATGWGVVPVAGGKRVWADLAVPATASASLNCVLRG